MSIHVKDQEKAIDFCTRVLVFKKKADIPMCEYQWLTVISPEGLEGVELVLETMAFEPACIYQAVLFETGISGAALITKDVSGELQLLKALGVIF